LFALKPTIKLLLQIESGFARIVDDKGLKLQRVVAMSMFKNPRDEEKLCQVLKAYVEEWGPENVIVSVPQHWSDYSTSSLGRVRLEFATSDTVSIRVEYDFVRVKYDVQLQAA
jgi:hypothetical protein